MIPPALEGYTIYTKRDCIFCDKAKELIRENNNNKVFLVECDEFDRELFLEFIDKLTPYCHRTFPYVFKDNVFIGGFTETERYEKSKEASDKSLAFYEDDF